METGCTRAPSIHLGRHLIETSEIRLTFKSALFRKLASLGHNVRRSARWL